MKQLRLTVPDLLRLRADREPERKALILDGHRSLTFAEWERRSDSAARGLRQQGVHRGDRLGLLFSDGGWIEYAIGCLAAQKAGAATVHLSAGLDLSQLAYRVRKASVSGIIRQADGPVPPGYHGWSASVETLEAGYPTAFDDGIGPLDIADIAFTSGTTNEPKAIAVPHGNLTYGRGESDDPLFPEEKILLSAWRMGTNASQATIVSALTANPSVLVTARPTPEHFAALISRLRVGAVMLSPHVAMGLWTARLCEHYDLTSVHAVGIGSAPVLPTARNALAMTFRNASIAVMYSSAESSPAFTSVIFPSWAEHKDPHFFTGPMAWSVGRPRAGTEVAVAGGHGDPLAPNQVGEVRLRSPAPSRWYDGEPAATSRVFRGGWIDTGDLGYHDAEGSLYLFDRASDAVTVDGKRVSTPSIEEALVQHPAILDAAVFGLPDDGSNQPIAAAIVLREPGSRPTLDELRAFLARRLAADEIPGTVYFMGSIPRNLMGKALKGALCNLATSGLL